MPIQNRTFRWAATAGIAGALVVFSSACSSRPRAKEAGKGQPMGSQVYVGPLTFTALEAEWKEQLEGENGPRLPKSRFLLLRVTVTNGGGSEQGLPLLTVVDSKGNSYLEEDKGEGVARWLGLLRVLKPAQTEEGYLIFDAPPGSYQLRVTTGGDPEQEMTALIDIPFRIDSAAPNAAPDIIMPEKK